MGPLFESLIHSIIYVLEGLGIFIIVFTATKDFIKYIKNSFNLSDDTIKIELAKSLALGLEFKLAAEILKTVTVRTLEEIYILGAIIILRVILTFVIHWEIEKDTAHCNSFLTLQKELCRPENAKISKISS